MGDHAVNIIAKEVLEGLRALGYSTDETIDHGETAWIVRSSNPGSRSVLVQEDHITALWMLHVTAEDIPAIEKYAIDQMWGVVRMMEDLRT